MGIGNTKLDDHNSTAVSYKAEIRDYDCTETISAP